MANNILNFEVENGIIYAIDWGRQKLCTSFDGGQTWRYAKSQIPGAVFSDLVMDLKIYREVVYIFTSSHDISGTSFVYISEDYGDNWDAKPIIATFTDDQFHVTIPIKPYISCVNINRDNNLMVGSIGDGIFISENKGVTWQRTPVGPLTSIVLEASQLVSINDYGYKNIYVGGYEGLLVSTNYGEDWTKLYKENDGLLAGPYLDVFSYNPFNPEIYVMCQSGISYGVMNADGAINWIANYTNIPDYNVPVPPAFQPNMFVRNMQIFQGVLYMLPLGNLFVAYDLTKIKNGKPKEVWRTNIKGGSGFPTKLRVDEDGVIYVLGGSAYFLKSIDNGVNWISITV